MGKHRITKTPSFFSKKEGSSLASNRLLAQQIDLLFSQNYFAIGLQLLFSLFLLAVLWNQQPKSLLLSWFVYLSGVYFCWAALTIYFHHYTHRVRKQTCLILISFIALLSGIGWGFAGSALLPAQHSVEQLCTMVLMFMVTTATLPFFSPILFVYLLFLLPAFIPFSIALFAQTAQYHLLGELSLVYLFAMIVGAYFLNRLILVHLSPLPGWQHFMKQGADKRIDELENTLALVKSTLESTAEGILVVDLNERITYYNQKFLDMWQMSELFNTEPQLKIFVEESLNQMKEPESFLNVLQQINNNPRQESFEEIIINEDRVFEWYSKPYWLNNTIVGLTWSFRDITIRKQMEQQLCYQANHDLLTSLPNRTLLYDRIKQGITFAKRYNTRLYLLFLDIDNFKLINDNLGHNIGDILLQTIALRLKSHTRESDTVARFGGDEFVVLFITNNHSDVQLLSEKILNTVSSPIELLQQQIVVSASIGVSIFPQDGEDAASLLKNADIAMYHTKNQGGNSVKLYDHEMKQHTEKSLAMQIELRNALNKNEFFLLYQPTIHLGSGKIIGVEALVRWNHPTKGILQPPQFIPIAEESQIILQLGEWVFNQACSQSKAWQQLGFPPFRIAINVSGIQLIRTNFLEVVEKALQHTGLDPQGIEIELTESTLMEKQAQTIETLHRLKDMGIHLAIDDFGTGYSSLHYLREFPIQKIKIDQSFIRDCLCNESDASLVEAIIAMGHGLRLTVLAEGIETAEQLHFLQQFNCDEGQGFFYAQPMTATEFAEFLKTNSH